MAKSTPSKPTSKTQKPAPLEGNTVWRERGRVRKGANVLRDKSAWEKLPGWAQHAICIGFLLVVALGFFSATTFGGKTLTGDDIVRWRGTAEAMLQYQESTGVDALWAPNVFGGMPGYMIHYPQKVLGVDSILRGFRSLGLWPVAHFFVLLLGTYLLVHLLTRSKLAGALAGVAFGLTTYLPIILAAGHNSKFVALSVAPWLLLGFAAILYRPVDSGWMRDVFLAGLFAIAAAVNLRAGHVQITYYVVVAAGIWWLAEGVASIRLGRLKHFTVSTGLLLLGAVLGLVMVAHPYLVQWEYKDFTIRSAGEGGGLGWAYAMAWSQGVKELFTLIVAGASGGASPTYWGPKTFTSGPHYVGALVFLLALFGIVGVARRASTGLGIAAFVMILFALGENLSFVNRPAFELLPLFASFRVPETWLAVVALVLAVLAGYGAYYIQRREATPEAEDRKTRRLYWGGGAMLALMAALYLAGGTFFEYSRPGEAEQIEMAIAQQAGLGRSDPRVQQAAIQYLTGVRAEREDMLRGDALRGLGVLLVAGLLVVLYRRRTLPAWVALAGLILLVTVDLWGVDRRYYNDDTPALRNRSDVATAVEGYEFDRFLQNQVEIAGGPGHFRVLPLALNPMNDARSPFFYESVGGYHGAKLALYQDYIDHLLFAEESGLPNRQAMDLMSTRYIITPQPLPGTTPVYQDEQTGLLVVENPTALPRAFLAERVEVVGSEEAMYARLLDPATDLRRTAFVYDSPAEPVAPAPIDSASTASVNLERYTPREIVWEVETDQPRLLVASEVYYPAGWTATIDDRPVPIVQVNHLLRGVQVPEGRHIVAMAFDPPLHRRGILISWLATLLVYLGVVVLGGLLWYRRGHPA